MSVVVVRFAFREDEAVDCVIQEDCPSSLSQVSEEPTTASERIRIGSDRFCFKDVDQLVEHGLRWPGFLETPPFLYVVGEGVVLGEHLDDFMVLGNQDLTV